MRRTIPGKFQVVACHTLVWLVKGAFLCHYLSPFNSSYSLLMRLAWMSMVGLLILTAASPAAAPPFKLVALSPNAFAQAARTAPATRLRFEHPLRKVKGVVRIPVGAGRYKRFVDLKARADGTNEVEQVTYTYLGYLPDFKHHLLLARYWESAEWLLVSDTGNTLPLWSEPLPSPDRTQLLTYNGSLDYEIMPTGMQLFRMVGGRLIKQWEYPLTTWEPRRVVWVTNQRLCLQGEVPDYVATNGRKTVFYRTLTLR